MKDDPERTTPIGMVRYAEEYHEAAIGADERLGTREGYEIVAPMPVLYLVGHSMELSLKSYLLHTGLTLKDIRKIGHNLQSCFEEAVKRGLFSHVTFNDHELEAFKVLSYLYSNKELEYIYTGAKTFPIFGYIETMSQKLVDVVSKIVGYSR